MTVGFNYEKSILFASAWTVFPLSNAAPSRIKHSISGQMLLDTRGPVEFHPDTALVLTRRSFQKR